MVVLKGDMYLDLNVLSLCNFCATKSNSGTILIIKMKEISKQHVRQCPSVIFFLSRDTYFCQALLLLKKNAVVTKVESGA